MTVHLTKETEDALKDFLLGITSAQDFETWIISAVDELTPHEQEAMWLMRLLLVEAGEGLRPLDEAREEARRLLDEDRPCQAHRRSGLLIPTSNLQPLISAPSARRARSSHTPRALVGARFALALDGPSLEDRGEPCPYASGARYPIDAVRRFLAHQPQHRREHVGGAKAVRLDAVAEDDRHVHLRLDQRPVRRVVLRQLPARPQVEAAFGAD